MPLSHTLDPVSSLHYLKHLADSLIGEFLDVALTSPFDLLMARIHESTRTSAYLIYPLPILEC